MQPWNKRTLTTIRLLMLRSLIMSACAQVERSHSFWLHSRVICASHDALPQGYFELSVWVLLEHPYDGGLAYLRASVVYLIS